MLTSTLENLEYAADYPDLAGRRVLVTGASGPLGIEIVRFLAEQRVRIVVQADDDGPETNALAEIISSVALDVRLFAGPLATSDDVLRFARTSIQSFGGVEAVVNIAHVAEPADGSEAAVEQAVTQTLALPCLVSRVAANRMRTTMTAGTILNILSVPRAASRSARLVASVARAALASLTRGEAAEWAPHGIRVNAVAPPSELGGPATGGAQSITGAADVATLALHLVSQRSHRLSGLVFEGWAG